MAAGWERLWQNPEIAKDWAERPPYPEVIEMAERLQAAGCRRVLDIGCGTGRHVIYLARRGFEVTATDNSPKAVSICKERVAEAGLRADIVESDMAELPFPEDYFAGVVASHVIHHAERKTIERILRLIASRLAAAGLFVWVTPTTHHCNCGRGEEIEPGTWVDPEHEDGLPHHYCSEEEVRELLQPFDIESLNESEHERDGRVYRHWRIIARKKSEADTDR
jgi:SAM-dependent methyltransferase